ncbi:hypothetical protein [Paenarthrobacter aromaticivorans]|uniref:DUF8175 domain-containing protein n=1 Tax=Paenarthrobacter aromaticivorans TaxID=2849150 RepID=A0ABS6I849_9MICC|nr:hypothetical protein [Paenarthrobacter sp. MMS21-TAE1-1]MBU8867881.1 hypothetical protein [Paenarthrobacter sp. MMS21-TAE1-1]
MSQSTESSTESNPFTKPGFIIAAGLVVALIAAAVVIFLAPKGQENAQPAPAESTRSVGASPSASAGSGKSVCGLPASKDTALGTAPKSKWELVGRMATPTDPKTFGPGVTDDSGFRSCFAQSPTGVLYAAMNVAALGSTGSPEIVAKLAEKLLVPGTGRDNAMREAAATPVSPNAASIQVRGFLIKSYTSSESNVDLAFETDSGALAHLTLSMRWKDGDWKVMPVDDGKTYSGPTQIRDLSGFILWSGV